MSDWHDKYYGFVDEKPGPDDDEKCTTCASCKCDKLNSRNKVMTDEDVVWTVNELLKQLGFEFTCESEFDTMFRTFVDKRTLKRKGGKDD